MDLLALIVIILQFAYIVFQHWTYQKEREKLELKLMSRNIEEYKDAVEPPAKDMPEKESPYKPLEEVPLDKQLEAKDRI